MDRNGPWMRISHLLLQVAGLRLALRFSAVREVVLIPQLTPMPGVPAYVAGSFELRGQVVPVLDLSVLLGRPSPFDSEARVVILTGEIEVGFVAGDMLDILDLETAATATPDQLLAGELRTELGVVSVLNPEALQRAARSVIGPRQAMTAATASPLPAVSAEERDLLRTRAERLRLAPVVAPIEGSSIAVVQLGRELFGFPLANVAEFARLEAIRPVPHATPHVLGFVELRGALLTLFDLRVLLGLPAGVSHEVVVMDEARPFGFPVDSVVDIVRMQRPAALTGRRLRAVPYGDRMVGILDPLKILPERPGVS